MKHIVLTDSDIIKTGKYRGTKMEDVPAEWLMWYYRHSKNKAPSIMNYIEDNMDVMRLELGDEFEEEY